MDDNKFKKLKKHKETWKYDSNWLCSRKEIQESYNVSVRNRSELLQEVDDINVYWQQLREIITEPAKIIIPRKEQKSKQKWMIAENLNRIDDRRVAKKLQEAAQYKEQDILIRNICWDDCCTWRIWYRTNNKVCKQSIWCRNISRGFIKLNIHSNAKKLMELRNVSYIAHLD